PIDTVFRIADIAIADRTVDRVSVTAAREPADTLAVAIDGLAPQEHDRGIGGKRGEQPRQLDCSLSLECGAPPKRRARFQLHGPAETGDQRRVIGPDLYAPRAVALFQAQR